MKNFANSLLSLWRQLGLNQRVSLGLAALVVVAGMAGLFAWSRQPEYQLLYGRLGDKDAATIISQLQAENIPHTVGAGGTSVYVPADQVYRLRMDLASKGVPTGDGVGFEIFDKGQFGLSDFVQRTNFVRALQGELSRTIAQLQGVTSARVMIVQPESRLLLTDQSVKPSASVFIELSQNRLEPEQVNAIRNLVANAVQGLVPDQVAVVDNHGHVLSQELKEDPLLSTASSQMRYRQQVEDYFAKKVESMLAPVVGAGQAVVRVSAEIDSESTTQTAEKFDPESAVIRSQTTTEDTSNTSEARSSGAVGVTANVPDKTQPTAAEANRPISNSDQDRKSHTTNYEINRVTTNTVRNPGSIRSLTAAVFVAQRSGPAPADPAGTPGGTAAPVPLKRTPQEMDDLRKIVANALGLKATPGQPLESLVSLEEVPFQADPALHQIQETENDTRVSAWVENGGKYLSVLGAFAALAVFWRMLRRQPPQPVPVELLQLPVARAKLGAAGPITPEMLNNLIRQKPANVGAALRDWVGPRKPA
jgi:flagellar M-ring protein FliF